MQIRVANFQHISDVRGRQFATKHLETLHTQRRWSVKLHRTEPWILMKSSATKHYGCKRARQCGLIANGRSQAYRDFSCARNINCCFAHCAANILPTVQWCMYFSVNQRRITWTRHIICFLVVISSFGVHLYTLCSNSSSLVWFLLTIEKIEYILYIANIRAVYTRENKPRITHNPRLMKAANCSYKRHKKHVRGLGKPRTSFLYKPCSYKWLSSRLK